MNENSLNIYQKFGIIDTLIFDVDGVFTDSQMLVTEHFEMLRSMHTQDGYAVKKAIEAGLNIAIITKGKSEGIKDRFLKLGVKHVYLNMPSKMDSYSDLLTKIECKNALYMGDDLSDIMVMKQCTIAACPNDAVADVLHISDFISPYEGGRGCVRDVIERVLRAQGKWN